MKKKDLHKMDVPFQGHYYMLEDAGTYHCRNCKQQLFHSKHKFQSGSGWPSFDQPIDASVTIDEQVGRGRPVQCSACQQFLGLLVKGEGFTVSDQRFDINSSALMFKPA